MLIESKTIDKTMYYLLLLFALVANLSTGATSTIIVLGTLLTIIKYAKQRISITIDKKLIFAIGLFTVTELITAIFSFHPLMSLKEVFSTFYRFFPLILVWIFIRDTAQIKNIFIAFMISVLINDCYGLYQAAVLGSVRPTAFNNSPTFFASHLLMAIPTLYLLAERLMLPPTWRYASYGTTILSILMLFASGTRGGWLALAVICVAFCLLAWRYYRKSLLSIGIIILLFGVLALSSSSIQNRLATLTDPDFQSNSERVLMWQSAITMFLDHPLTGIGQGCYQEIYNTQYISPLAKERGAAGGGHSHPHNNILKVLAEGGIIGISGFLFLHGYLFYLFWRLYRRDLGNPYALAALLVMLGIHSEGMTDWNIAQVPIMREYWFLLGVFLSAYHLENRRGFSNAKLTKVKR